MERIRGLGTSWYTRGGKYWTLRVVAAFMMFLVLLFSTGMTVGFGYGLWRIGAPVWVRVLLLAVVFASIVRSSVKAWAAFIRVERGRRAGRLVTLAAAAGDAGSDRRVRRAGWAGGATGVLAAMGSGLAGALLVISVAFNFGWFVVMFVAAFGKYYGEEYAARARLQQWCDAHGVPNPLTT